MSSFLLRSVEASARTTDSSMLVNEACVWARNGWSKFGVGDPKNGLGDVCFRIDFRDLGSVEADGRTRVVDGVRGVSGLW